MNIDVRGQHYREINELLRRLAEEGHKRITLENVNGQRYLGAGLSGECNITIYGTPGNDLACFLDGPSIRVYGNGQDGIGNTMNRGKVAIHGSAGDIVGHSMRGGKILIRGNAGYRAGIHMKAYGELFPVIVIGGTTGDFLGEYMAGGLIIVLRLGDTQSSFTGHYIGTGMHGGAIYIRGSVEPHQVGREVAVQPAQEQDLDTLRLHLEEYSREFSLDLKKLLDHPFTKLIPYTSRPYGTIYAY